jgi:hypothetical protein
MRIQATNVLVKALFSSFVLMHNDLDFFELDVAYEYKFSFSHR